MILGPHTVTRVRAGAKSSGYGTTTEPDWDNPAASDDFAGCSVQPEVGAEFTNAGDVTTTRWGVWMPGDPDVLATDRIVWAGDTYEIQGSPQHWAFVPGGHTTLTIVRVQ